MNRTQALALIANSEDEHTERKLASNSFGKEKLCKYVSALANEGGGHLIMGVKDDGTILGAEVFKNINALKIFIYSHQKMSKHLRIETDVFEFDGKRVLIFTIPPRPQGEAISYEGAFYMRSGESLVTMDTSTLKKIADEHVNDYSAEIVAEASVEDLDPSAIELARQLWLKKSGNQEIAGMSKEEVLAGLDLMDDRGLTLAAVILLGKERSISRYVANAEVVWEYRKSSNDIEYVSRTDYKTGFILYFDELWGQIDVRNDVAHITEGFVIRDIAAFSEVVVREAVLNAIAHRNYQDTGSVYIRQSSEELLVESPGGFVDGVTAENIIDVSSRPRNRRIAEAFQKLGLVERSGQGADKIFKESIIEGKGLPDYNGTTPNEVKLRVNAKIQDLAFIKYLEHISTVLRIRLGIKDYVLLERVRMGEIKSMNNDPALAKLSASGIIESSRNGRYSRPILSKDYYSAFNKRGEYTRTIGLDFETKKAIILKHLQNYRKGYIKDLEEALANSVKRSTLNSYLDKIRNEGLIEFIGNKNIGRGPNQGYWQLIEQSKRIDSK